METMFENNATEVFLSSADITLGIKDTAQTYSKLKPRKIICLYFN